MNLFRSLYNHIFGGRPGGRQLPPAPMDPSGLKRRFKTAEEAIAWLRTLPPCFDRWEESDRTGWLYLWTDYPLKLNLPDGIALLGVAELEAPLPKSFFESPDLALVARLTQLVKQAPSMHCEEASVQIMTYFKHGTPTHDGDFWYTIEPQGTRLSFSSGYIRESEPEQTQAAYRELFDVLGIKANVTGLGAAPGIVLLDGTKPEHTDGSSFVRSDDISFPVREEYPGQVLEKMAGLAKRQRWKLPKPSAGRPQPHVSPASALSLNFEWPRSEAPEDRAGRQLACLNEAHLPITQTQLRIVYRLNSWEQFAVLRKLEELDSNEMTHELEILRVAFDAKKARVKAQTPEVEGHVLARPIKSGFEISFWPPEGHDDEGAFRIGLWSVLGSKARGKS